MCHAHTTIRDDPGSASNLLPFATSGVLPVDMKTCDLADLGELLHLNADTGTATNISANAHMKNCVIAFIFF